LSVAKNPSSGKDDTAREPAAARVWALIGDKAGDNAQVLALAAALGEPWRTIHLAYNGAYRVWNLVLGARRLSLDRARSDALAPPWPDLVIAIGRRSVPIARWIKARSGGRARLVHLGRPRAPYGWFDLIVTTPQYAVPGRANVMHLPLPLVAERARRPETGPSGRHLVLLVGGDSGPWRLDADRARALGRQAAALARQAGGRLTIATSRRTGAAATEALATALGPKDTLHRFGAAGVSYDAILAAADGFIVTADSVSMMADAAATGRPLLLARLDHRPSPSQRLAAAARVLPGYTCAVDLGLVARPRDLAAVADALVAAGHARWLDDDPDLAAVLPYDGAAARERVAARVRALLDEVRRS
jgi:mitochondrial fission protein ELM1